MQTPIRSKPSAPAALWTLALASFLLNVVLIALLILGIMWARRLAADTADALIAFGNQDINYTLRLNQTVPVRAEVPFVQNVVVPIRQTIDVNTVVTVSRELPVVGVLEFDVPIQASIPVQFDVTIPVSQTFPVNTDVPLNMEIPLSIRVSDTSLKSTIDSVARALNTFAGR
ncbi:MAG: hypothetical protein RMN25_00230 [Anaerolineae bacterium]|nr:hypothetical protein [Thermoflexales bacterium]MDW8406186.1 hypothetical protein [Anaerolineae bacterium]